MPNKASARFDLLRQQAEELLRNQPEFASDAPSNMLDLIHELNIHQAELEIQNEELKQAQAELSETQREYEDLYEFAPCAYLTLNHKGIITKMNLTGVRLLGNPKNLVMHSGFGRFLDPKWEDHYLAARKKSAQTGETQSIELPLNKENGSPLWVRAEIEARKGESDEVVQWRMVLVDITERKKAEEALRESESKLRTLIAAVPDMVWEFDENEVFTFCSQSYKKTLGYEPSELVGTSAYAIMPPNEAEKTKKAFEAIKRERKPLIDFLNVNLDRNGETKWIHSSAVPIIDDDGKYRGYRGIDRDITDIRKVQEEKEVLEEQLQQARKMEAIGTLAGGIAHEFNNVLGIILGNAELALDDVPHWNPASESLKEIKTASMRAKDVVRQILAFARKSMFAREPFEIATVTRECLKLMRASIPTTIHMETDIACGTEMVLGDSTEMHQVLMNLCTNAAQAMGVNPGTLTVTLSTVTLDDAAAAPYEDIDAGNYVRLCVKDDGCGVKPEILERIFDPYFTTKGVGEGTGMGLAVVYGIVKKANGAIRATSQLGEGTTIEVLLPLHEGAQETEAHKEKPLAQKGRGERILFVDDEPSLVNLFKQNLERLGYAVTGMADSLSALECFKSDPQKYDLVITDMAMPQMAGEQMALEMLKIRPDLPILICTGHSQHVDEKRAKQLGIRGYISKPLDRKELAMAVAKLLKGA